MQPNRSLNFRALKFAAAVHLFLTVCGATRLVIPINTIPGKAIAHYQAYTGAGNSYGFFAPAVASPKRVVLHGYRAKTNEWVTQMETGVNRETELRLSTTFGLFSQPQYHESIAASWAAWMFGNDPEVSTVIVEIQTYAIPTMSEFRAGDRAEWQAMEVYPFARNITHEP